jgi:hypothetical protein
MAFPYWSGMTVLRIVPLLHQFEHGLFVRRVQGRTHQRKRLRSADVWALCREYRRHRSCVPRNVQGPRFQDISLNDWLTHIPPELVIEHLGISQQTLSAIPRANYAVLPA